MGSTCYKYGHLIISSNQNHLILQRRWLHNFDLTPMFTRQDQFHFYQRELLEQFKQYHNHRFDLTDDNKMAMFSPTLDFIKKEYQCGEINNDKFLGSGFNYYKAFTALSRMSIPCFLQYLDFMMFNRIVENVWYTPTKQLLNALLPNDKRMYIHRIIN